MPEFGEIGQKNYSEYQIRRIKESTDRINRWHDKQINFLSTLLIASNSVAVLSLGFVIRSFKNELFKVDLWYEINAGRTICMILIVSISFGVLSSLSRFYDIRTTTRLNRNKKKEFILNHNLKYKAEKAYSKAEIEVTMSKQRNLIKNLETSTYWFFYLQLASWVIGVVLVIYNV